MKNLQLTLCLIGGALKASAQDRDVYYSNPSAGYGSVDVVANWIIYSRLAAGIWGDYRARNEFVKVSANTLAAEGRPCASVTTASMPFATSFGQRSKCG
jgi:hypothetical protein